MITLEQFIKTIKYRINSGDKFGWECYGPNARCIDSISDFYSISVVFDSENQQVYESTVCDYRNNAAYRIINPLFQDAYFQEARKRESNPNNAWDDVDYIDVSDWTFLREIEQVINIRSNDKTLGDYINRMLSKTQDTLSDKKDW